MQTATLWTARMMVMDGPLMWSDGLCRMAMAGRVRGSLVTVMDAMGIMVGMRVGSGRGSVVMATTAGSKVAAINPDRIVSRERSNSGLVVVCKMVRVSAIECLGVHARLRTSIAGTIGTAWGMLRG